MTGSQKAKITVHNGYTSGSKALLSDEKRRKTKPQVSALSGHVLAGQKSIRDALSRR